MEDTGGSVHCLLVQEILKYPKCIYQILTTFAKDIRILCMGSRYVLSAKFRMLDVFLL